MDALRQAKNRGTSLSNMLRHTNMCVPQHMEETNMCVCDTWRKEWKICSLSGALWHIKCMLRYIYYCSLSGHDTQKVCHKVTRQKTYANFANFSTQPTHIRPKTQLPIDTRSNFGLPNHILHTTPIMNQSINPLFLFFFFIIHTNIIFLFHFLQLSSISFTSFHTQAPQQKFPLYLALLIPWIAIVP